MEQEKLNNPEQEEKFTKKDKIVGSLLIGVILLEIIVLVITIKNEKEKNYFEVSSVSKTYAYKTSDEEGLKIKMTCNDSQKIIVSLEKGTLNNKDNNLELIEDNKYKVNCKENEFIYWLPSEGIENEEIIKLKFKIDNTSSEEQELKIQKEENEYKIIE